MRLLIGVSFLALGLAVPAAAQRQPTPEQRIERLERQLQQVQGRVFQRGQPADTAGFAYEPAAPLSAVSSVNDRLAALERQLAEIQRLSEENGNRLRTIEADAARARTEQADRVAALERRVQELSAAPAVASTPTSTVSQPSLGDAPRPVITQQPSGSQPTATTADADDPGEEAYSAGFRLWQAGDHQEAIGALRSFIRTYPRHRRISWANNLVGRALLDSGQPREAANALLENYRSNPRGERAADSLYYLGQALMKLGQSSQACNAYAELEAVYGDGMRAELKKLLPDAKAQARCR